MKKIRSRNAGTQTGIALFMVMSTLAVLSVVVAELTYTTQVGLRMSYNYIDNLKAYYQAKAGLKVSLIRLKAYTHVNGFLNDKNNKEIKNALSRADIEKIWSFPFMFPLPIPPKAEKSQEDSIKEFAKKSSFSGQFFAEITPESTKLNLNNLFIKEIPKEPTTPAKADDKSKPAETKPPEKENPEDRKVEFRPLLEQAITLSLEENKKNDLEFSDTYRNILAKDIVDAIEAYLFTEKPRSELPGFTQMTAKNAPLYSLTELHLIPGLSDDLYNLLEKIVTVYSTPGINVNKASKSTFKILFPDLSDEELIEFMKQRDDPLLGKLWESEDAFWDSVKKTSLGNKIEDIKKGFKKAYLKIIVDETSFKITVKSTQGQAIRTLTAYVILDSGVPNKDKAKAKDSDSKESSEKPKDSKDSKDPKDPKNPKDQDKDKQKEESSGTEKDNSGINLIYWRMT